MQRQIELDQVVDAASQSLKNTLYHCWPGAIVTYDSSSQRASVRPMVNDPRRDPVTGLSYGEPWPILQGVPVAWMRAGGFTLSGTLNPGDPVVLIAWDIDPTPWLKQGASQPGTTQAVNPADVRRHGGGYWWAMPCNFYGPIADVAAAAAGLVIGKDGDTAQIRFAPGSVKIGRAATHSVAFADALSTALGNACTAASAAVVPGDGGAGAFTAFKSSLATAASSYASVVAKAQ